MKRMIVALACVTLIVSCFVSCSESPKMADKEEKVVKGAESSIEEVKPPEEVETPPEGEGKEEPAEEEPEAKKFSDYLDELHQKARQRNEDLADILGVEVPVVEEVPEPGEEEINVEFVLGVIAFLVACGAIAISLIALLVSRERRAGGGGRRPAPGGGGPAVALLLIGLMAFTFLASSVEAGTKDDLRTLTGTVAEQGVTLDMLVAKAKKEADAKVEQRLAELEGFKSAADSLKIQELAGEKTLAQILADAEKRATEAGKKQAEENARAIAAIRRDYIKECAGSERELAAVIATAAGIDLASVEIPESAVEESLTPAQKLKRFIEGTGEGYSAGKWQGSHAEWAQKLAELIAAARQTTVVSAAEERPAESEIEGLSKAALVALDQRYAHATLEGKKVLREGDIEAPAMPDLGGYATEDSVMDALREVGLLDGEDLKEAALKSELASELAKVKGIAEGAVSTAETASANASAAKSTAETAQKWAKATAKSHASHLERKDRKEGFVTFCQTLKGYGLSLADLGWTPECPDQVIEELAKSLRKEKPGLSEEESIRMAKEFILKKEGMRIEVDLKKIR